MNTFLWVLQIVAALLYGASGVMKVFFFDKISGNVPSFGALPREGWLALGIFELICVAGLVLPAALRWQPGLTGVAAAALALESLVFIWVHVQYKETGSIVMSAVLGLAMAFLAYGRLVVKPIVETDGPHRRANRRPTVFRGLHARPGSDRPDRDAAKVIVRVGIDVRTTGG